jgi:hypothetical protein
VRSHLTRFMRLVIPYHCDYKTLSFNCTTLTSRFSSNCTAVLHDEWQSIYQGMYGILIFSEYEIVTPKWCYCCNSTQHDEGEQSRKGRADRFIIQTGIIEEYDPRGFKVWPGSNHDTNCQLIEFIIVRPCMPAALCRRAAIWYDTKVRACSIWPDSHIAILIRSHAYPQPLS